VRYRRGATTAIIVDEAHLLNWDLMEEIRLLTNLETAQHKLVQMVLVGQPELDQKLDSYELRQLKQRVSLRCQLKPLTFTEVHGYIHHRLEIAGANSHGTTIFPDETIGVIDWYSGGIPRVINNLCENSLVSGYGKQMKEITVEIVREVASDLRLNQVTVTRTEGQQRGDAGVGVPLVPKVGTNSERSTELQPRVERQ